MILSTRDVVASHPIMRRFGLRTPCLFTTIHSFSSYHSKPRLCDHGAGGRALVPPGRLQGADGLVVARQAVDAGLDENQAELGVLVLAVALEVLADGDGLRCDIPRSVKELDVLCEEVAVYRPS